MLIASGTEILWRASFEIQTFFGNIALPLSPILLFFHILRQFFSLPYLLPVPPFVATHPSPRIAILFSILSSVLNFSKSRSSISSSRGGGGGSNIFSMRKDGELKLNVTTRRRNKKKKKKKKYDTIPSGELAR